MNWKNYVLITVATFLILLAGITSFLIVQSNNPQAKEGTQSNTANTQENTSSNEDSNVQITITNNIQTVVNGESTATVENKVKNNISDNNTNLENTIQNDSNDQATITVNNAIENIFKGDLQGTLRNNITNNLLSSGKSELANNILNDLQTKAQIELTNEVNNNSKQPQPPENNTSAPNEGQPSDTTNNSEKPPEEANTPPENTPPDNKELTYIWGIDSASETTEEFYACVRENLGEPKIFARYLGTKEGVSSGLTAEQVKLIHANGADILPIYNGFTDATGYDNGVAQAQEAISLATDLGIPEGVAIFADIEPTYPVDAGFIQGWYDGITSSNYKPAIYGSFDPENEIVNAFNTAVQQKAEIQQNTYIWSSSPSIGVSKEVEAPTDYTVEAPEGSLSYGWQYGINSETCNIDTNLFDSKLTEALWQN
ncbi:glycoside hydrolase domain-containing protein [Bacillus sp. B1-b2]|uniref:glycoside hydrolase domain-containing protein n=1 Tax=Bacillus sp. B1-b2 TaxID=2653201 RepID=UPI001261FA04|nr:glycoside hydrolase domain-containing protein [Bacillus sp. B1-b2]KAB7671238.1 DUF1906 domain-containing protein [Bacillus sp. B1-b2]